MLCMECGHELERACGPMTETYKGREYTVDGIERDVCPVCGEYEISASESNKLDQALAEAYRRDEGLLTPSEIKALRKDLELNQKEFEALIGVSTPTCSRWETGSMMQSRTADKLMRVFIDHPEYALDALQPGRMVATSSKTVALPKCDAAWGKLGNTSFHDRFSVIPGGRAA
nr:MAG TPA: putative zinc finger/helix-turn-helix protein, YgiT family [Caudoviricetes sp.]